jgi:hypothetical protein
MQSSTSPASPVTGSVDQEEEHLTVAGKVFDFFRRDPVWLANAAVAAFACRLHWNYAFAALIAAEQRKAAEVAAARAVNANGTTPSGAAAMAVPMQLQFAAFVAVLLMAVVLRYAIGAPPESEAETSTVDDGSQSPSANSPPRSMPPMAPQQPDWETVSEESGSLQANPAANVTRGSAVASRDHSVSSTAGLMTAGDGASVVDSAVMANMDDVYAMLAAMNARREAAMEGATLSADEFEALRQDVHRELFCGSPVSTLATEDIQRGGGFPQQQPPTPNASTVHGEAPTAPPSAASFDLGTRRSQSPAGSVGGEVPAPMLDVLRAAVAESMAVHKSHRHEGHAAPEVDVEALYMAYCADPPAGEVYSSAQASRQPSP